MSQLWTVEGCGERAAEAKLSLERDHTVSGAGPPLIFCLALITSAAPAIAFFKGWAFVLTAAGDSTLRTPACIERENL